MEAKEKAAELINRFQIHCASMYGNSKISAKNVALICVEELIKAFKELSIQDSGSVFRDFGHTYWEEVKKHLTGTEI